MVHHSGWDHIAALRREGGFQVQDPQPGLVQYVKDNWLYLAIIAAVIVGAMLAIMPRMKRKREQDEKTKIEFAIEIEKAMQGEK